MTATTNCFYIKLAVVMLGQKIRSIRLLKNIQTVTMAEKMGITPQGYSRIERNEVDVSYENLKNISDALGVTISDIEDFGETPPINIFDNHDNNMVFVMNYNSNSEFTNKDLQNLLELITKQNQMLIEMIGKIMPKN